VKILECPLYDVYLILRKLQFLANAYVLFSVPQF